MRLVDLFVAALLLQSLSMRMGRASLKPSCSPAESVMRHDEVKTPALTRATCTSRVS